MMTKEQIEFYGKFEQEFGDRIIKLALGRVIGDPAAVQNAGLRPLPGKSELWGLLIIGEKGIHFYAHASDNAIMSLFRSSTGSAQPESQYLYIPFESICGLTVPAAQKRHFWRLFGGISDLRVSFTYNKPDGNFADIAVLLSVNNTEVFDELRKISFEKNIAADKIVLLN